MAHEMAQAEATVLNEVTNASAVFSRDEKYGYAPREKPAHSICIVMENFNSLRKSSKNAKVNAINNLCRDFKVDILCGCKTQVDWQMVPQACCFHNLFGVGLETRSVVAHNISKRMQQYQFRGCAMMAMGTISPEVVDSGVVSPAMLDEDRIGN
jgi:hypothetical protein